MQTLRIIGLSLLAIPALFAGIMLAGCLALAQLVRALFPHQG